MNLNGDLRQGIIDWFSQINITVDQTVSTHELLERFANTQTKLIRSRPRKVFISDSVGTKQLTQVQATVLKDIQHKLEQGKDICPHLNKGSLQLDFDDDLLNDWGIHHLHLSNTKCDPTKIFLIERAPYCSSELNQTMPISLIFVHTATRGKSMFLQSKNY